MLVVQAVPQRRLEQLRSDLSHRVGRDPTALSTRIPFKRRMRRSAAPTKPASCAASTRSSVRRRGRLPWIQQLAAAAPMRRRRRRALSAAGADLESCWRRAYGAGARRQRIRDGAGSRGARALEPYNSSARPHGDVDTIGGDGCRICSAGWGVGQHAVPDAARQPRRREPRCLMSRADKTGHRPADQAAELISRAVLLEDRPGSWIAVTGRSCRTRHGHRPDAPRGGQVFSSPSMKRRRRPARSGV